MEKRTGGVVASKARLAELAKHDQALGLYDDQPPFARCGDVQFGAASKDIGQHPMMAEALRERDLTASEGDLPEYIAPSSWSVNYGGTD